MTVLDRLRERAELTPERVAYDFLAEGDGVTDSRTWAELVTRAQAVAASLPGQPGDRVLLAFDEGLPFLDAFFGCLWAGRLAVPVHAPDPRRPQQTVPRLRFVAEDAGVSCVLTTSDLVPALAALGRPALAVDTLPTATAPYTPGSLAYLQYTSGSTSEPKGVRASHEALAFQVAAYAKTYRHSPDDVLVSWLPATHDLGMVYGRLVAAWVGLRCVFFPPPAFVQRPARWMRALATFGGTHSASPNFGFDLAARRPTPDELAGMDLSAVRMLLNGAEPIRRDSEERFAARYAPYGLRRGAITHSYGMSEATAMITSEALLVGPRFVDLDPAAYERNRAVLAPPGSADVRTVANNGPTPEGTDLRVVDPETLEELPEGAVGELWVGGVTVSDGYWGRPELSAEVFGARTRAGAGPFLRTGDLGFVLDRDVFISGRRKDVIILRGQNLHPSDLERAVEAAHRAVRPGGAAALSVPGPEGEQLAVAAEVPPDADATAVLAAIRAALGELGLAAGALVLVPPRTLPKTSSGKLQRALARQQLLADVWPILARAEPGRRDEVAAPAPAAEAPTAPSDPRRDEVLAAPDRARAVARLLRAETAARLGLDPEDIEVDRPFQEFGLDSVSAVALIEDVCRVLRLDVPRTTLFDHPTVVAMARHLAERLGGPVGEAPAAPAEARPRAAGGKVAIVGMACRFPAGAEDPESYWALLERGEPVAAEVPADRWEPRGDRPAPRAALLRDVAGFDAAFFGLSAPEATMTDPQQRLFLEVGWEALEDAGLRVDQLRGTRTGVFVGAGMGDWRGRVGAEAYRGSPFGLTGTDPSFVAGRFSYVLGLRGPAVSVMTACSSSLVALHHAVRALQHGDCALAVAGGVSLVTDPDGMSVLDQIRALAPDGTCKTFSADADGYGRGEGCGVLVLERLEDALAAGRRVLAVVEGIAVNHDGQSSALTAPSGPAQRAVLREALADAGRTAAEVGFLECHGTGTPLGDPIEVRAAAEALAPADRPAPLLLGSAKAVVGHLEAAAAMAGILKVILAFRHGRLPPNRVRAPNPDLPLDAYPLRVVTEGTPWAGELAGVSSFGLSGTNAHVLLARPPAPPEAAVARGELPTLLPVSGRSEAAVRALLERVAGLPEDPRDVAAALLRRAPLERRAAALVRADGARDPLADVPVRDARGGPVAFVFAGQGAQRPGMAAALYARFPAFRTALDAALEALRTHVAGDLHAALLGDDDRVHHTALTQPALFAVQVAQAALWRSLGIVPDVVVGHSVGEFAAAVVAGALDLPDAARLVAARGAAMGALRPGGAMVALAASEAQVRSALVWGAEIAAVNGPRAVVLSGEESAVSAVAAKFAKSVRLTVSHAFHSARMEPALAALRAAAERVTLREPAVRWLPTGRSKHAPGSAGYWVDQARGVVAFADAVRAAHDAVRPAAWLELGATPALLPMVGQTLDDDAPALLATLGPAAEPDLDAFFRAAGQLWAAGHEVDLAALLPAGKPAPLPAYPWQKVRYWVDAPAADAATAGVPTGHPLLGARLATAGELALFEARWSTQRLPWLADHRVAERVVVPGAALLEALRAAGQAARSAPVELADVAFERPLAAPALVQLHVDADAVRLFARDGDGPDAPWLLHAAARLAPRAELAPPPALPALRDLDLEAVQRAFADAGLRYGPAFRGLRALRGAPGAAEGALARELPADALDPTFALAPALLDAAFQASAGADTDPPGLPFALDLIRVRPGTPTAVRVLGRDLWLLDDAGRTVAEVRNLRVRPAAPERPRLPDAVFREVWVALPLALREPVTVPADGDSALGDVRVLRLPDDPEDALVRLLDLGHLPDGARALVLARGPASAAARGFLRALAAERPGLRLSAVDAAPELLPDVLSAEAAADPEPAVRWVADPAGPRREVRRLRPDRALLPPPGPNFRLAVSPSGSFADLALVPATRREPAPGEVEVAVHATGLNFRDVMNALGVYPGDAGLPGYELAGTVVRVGEGAPFAVGDRVMAQGEGGFARFATLDARRVAPVPPGFSDAEAAATPLAFLTALYAFRDLAKLQPGEKVLVHAAAGGVGMAAVQLARWLGAEVYATASPAKWPVLRELGVAHLASSRDLAFASAWSGAGLDVVLNALAGPFVDASLGLLKPGGRFVELGKTDVRAAVRGDVTYRAFDLAEAGPDRLRELFAELGAAFAAGQLRPPRVTAFDYADLEAAFRALAAGQNVGKFVVRAGALRPGAVLVTGGTGALGRVAARDAVRRGATLLVLASRSGGDAAALSAHLGVPVLAPALDVTDADALKALLGALPVPLRGVVHAAGVLDDALVRNTDPDRLRRVLAPKLAGLRALEAATDGLDLDLFVTFGSLSAVLGNPGQAAYAAANALLDDAMADRRARGLPGACLQWGPWAGTGLAAGLRPDGGPVGLLDPDDGAALLDALLTRGGPSAVAARLDLRAVTEPVPAALRELVGPRSRRTPTQDLADLGAFARSLAQRPAAERRNALRDAVRDDVARVLSAPVSGDAVPLQDLGLDSLLAVELRNTLARRTGQRLPATLAFDHPSVEALTAFLFDRLRLDRLDAATAPTPPVAASPRAAAREPVAVVGMACRFPAGADDPDAYWRLLLDGKPVAGPVPPDRWDHDAIFQPGEPAPGKTNSAAAAFLTDAAGFDAAFFGISAPEARALDPQQRLLLEVAWEALEDAGLRVDRLRGTRTGVFVGASPGTWDARMPADERRASPYALTGSDLSFLAGRLSWQLGLRGPSSTVSTACSSGLVALHQAAAALLAGEAELAVAGGVRVMTDGEQMVVLSQLGALARDGACKTFSADADGYGRGEGCGVLVLERLSDARRNGHRVLALVEGSAVNHDGRSSGLTAPSGPAQQAVLREALAAARRKPADVSYLECHGTGTVLGDPIEVRAAAEVLATDRAEPLLLGSAKAVVGHLEAAAGMAGAFKVLLALKHRLLPPNPVRALNPELPLAEFPLRVVTETTPWAGDLAGVSSFGLSGTNAHVLFGRAPDAPPTAATRGELPTLLPVSGRADSAVRELLDRVAASPHDPRDLAAALLRRAPLERRAAALVRADGARDLADVPVRDARGGPVAFVFAGQGAQRPGMAAALYARFPAFRTALDAALEALRPHVAGDLHAALLGDDDRVHHTALTQPALFATQLAQAALWRSLGLRPDVVVGHSVGEFAAAVVAGALDLPDAARLVAARGAAMGALRPGGAMVALAASEAQVRSALVWGAEIAAVNGPRAVVLSGEESAVSAVAAKFAKSVRLTVSHAFHSARMEPALAALRAAAERVTLREPAVRWLPTGRSKHTPGSAGYWVDQARGVVAFADAVRAAHDAVRPAAWLELGATPALLPMVGQTLDDDAPALLATLGPAAEPDLDAFFRAAGQLWAAGHDLDLDALLPAGRPAPLPAYPWQRTRFWVDAPGAHAAAAGAPTGHPLLGARLATAGDLALFEARWSAQRLPWLADHRVAERVVVPGAALLEALRAAGQAARSAPVELADVAFERPLAAPALVQLHVDGDAVRLFARDGDGPDAPWLLHAAARLAPRAELAPPPALPPLRDLDLHAVQRAFADAGLRYGPAFRGLVALRGAPGAAEGALARELPAGALDPAFALAPALLDAAFQTSAGADTDPPGLPFALDLVRVRPGTPTAVRVLGRDLWLLDDAGQPVAEVRNLRVRPAAPERPRLPDAVFREAWVALPLALRGPVTVPADRDFALGDVRVLRLPDDPEAALLRLLALAELPDGARALVLAQGPASAAARGFLRSLAAERPALLLSAVDAPPELLAAVLAAEAAADPEPAVRWVADPAGPRREVRRLRPDRALLPPPGPNFRLAVSPSGSFADLALVPATRREPAPGEVEVAVHATGLNFRDVMNALGVYPGDAGLPGYELAGTVVRVGEGAPFAVGDRVMAQGEGGFARFATLDARRVAPVPAGFSDAEAAGTPLAFLTALYAFRDLAKLQPGEKVLVHAAAGGVGMAAVQLARWLGAEVYATASPAKWPVLRELGVAHLASSRDLAFASAWSGAGLDVVLNALAGPFVDASLGLLKPGGRFVEMGKTDVRAAVRGDVTYRAFDLAEAGPDRLRELFAELGDAFAAGHLRPPRVTAFDYADLEAAFRALAAGQNVGKFVVRAGALRPGAVLVTGGTGALGRVAARDAVRRGATLLVLAARSGGDAQALSADLGVPVLAPALDVTDVDALKALLGALPVPLRGVVHAAGVLDDALVRNTDPDRLRRVLAPKLAGLRALEAATDGLDLDLFVTFGSLSAVLGNPGQAAYAAANALLDDAMADRRARGLPGACLQWGPWAGTGLAAGLRPDGGPVGLLDPDDGAALLDALLTRGGPSAVAARLDLRAVTDPVPATLRELVGPRSRRTPTQDPDALGAFARSLAQRPPAERRNALRDAVRDDVARVLSAPVSGDAVPLQDLGMDSLLAVELRNTLARRTGQRLPATLAFDHPSVDALTAFLFDKLALERLDAAAPAAPVAAAPRAAAREPVAVVGMACRFPAGADDPDAYWRLLLDGKPVAGPVPPDRWDHDAIFQPGEPAPGKTNSAAAAFLTDAAGFDAAFFGISAPEARALDPQQRLLLEVAWEALEDGGLRVDRLQDSRTAVIVGAAPGTWDARIPDEERRGSPYALTGSDLSFVSGRLAFALGLRGPTLTVSTACSSALVAVHHAARAVAAGEADLALAAGVGVLTDGEQMVVLSQLGALARDGACKTFSADADGYGRGEGCGVLVLERLSDARRNGHRVLALVEGSAVNHDGRSSGLTAPSGPAQQAVLREALAAARRKPADVSYLECHGTGTVLGDPIEVRAAAEVLATDRAEPLLLGSAKAVVGHLEAAAGMAGAFKVLLALKHRLLPPNPVRALNPELPLAEFPLRVVTETTPWAGDLAGVSSFGLSGTNAHVLFGRAPDAPPTAATRGELPTLLPVSGRADSAVRELLDRVAASPHDPRDLAAALLRRAPLERRAAALVRADGARDLADVPVRDARGGPVAFVFAGQGAQRPGMAAALYARFPAFRTALDAALEALRTHVAGDLHAALLGDDDRVHHTALTQPALFATQLAQAALWRSLGLRPDVVVGHSVGEFAAAVVAGALDLPDAARLVAARGAAMGALRPGGAMVALSASEADVRASLVPGAEVAAVNGPRAVVISGEEPAVAAVAARFTKRTRLTVSHAFHSARMGPALPALRAAAEGVTPREPAVRWLPTGRSAHPTGSPGYWVDQARGFVAFADAVRAAHDAVRPAAWLELGATPALLGMIGQTLDDAPTLLATLGPASEPDLDAFFRAAGQLWATGHSVDLAALLPPGRAVPLPAYPWQKVRHWVAPRADGGAGGVPTGHPLLGARVDRAGADAAFVARWSRGAPAWLADHRVAGGDDAPARVLVPGAALVEVLHAAAVEARGPAAVARVVVKAPVTLPEHGGVAVQVVVEGDAVALWTREADGPWVPAVEGEVEAAGDAPLAPEAPALAPQDVDGLYGALGRLGLDYGPAFRALRSVSCDADRAVAEIETPVLAIALDAALQAVGAMDGLRAAAVPFEFGRFTRFGPASGALRALVTRAGSAVDVVLVDGPRVVAVAEGVALRPLDGPTAAPAAAEPGLWRLTAVPAALPRVAPGPDDLLITPEEDPVETVVQAIAAVRTSGERRLWLVGDGTPAGRALLGLGRALRREQPDRPIGVVEAVGVAPRSALVDTDEEARVDADGAAIVRLERAPSPFPDAPNWRLDDDGTGTLDGLAFRARPRLAPPPGHVEVEVLAAGLNFRDVMHALGMYPGDAGPYGQEGAGRVVASADPRFHPGDAVLMMAPGALSRFVTVDARLVAPKPDGLSFEEAATVPIAFLTAWYAIFDLARAAPGERIVVHAAAGGVGMAAVQVARLAGLRVYATASPAKWDVVRGLGVAKVASSRDLSFAQAFRNEGIDIVLDALSREFVDAGLSLLRPGGRFVEMGKTDVRDPASVPQGIDYVAFDLWDAGPDRLAAMLGEIVARLADGRLRPLPHRAFPFASARDAFRTMAQAKHTGKLVLVPGTRELRTDGAVLVTGGLGALGLEVAAHLAGRGVRELVLASRQGPAAPGADAARARLEALGAAVSVVAADATDEDALRAAIAGRTLRGVIHAAGVLDDALVADTTDDRVRAVVAPKVHGARVLDRLAREHDVDVFVLFTSLAGVLGSAGQTAYAAANAALDGLAEQRRAEGLPATAIAWGPWAEVGMAATLGDALQQRLARQGLRAWPTARALALLDEALRRPEAVLVAADLDPAALTREEAPTQLRGLLRRAAARPSAAAAPRSAGALPASAFARGLAGLLPAQRRAAVLEAVRREVATALSAEVGKVPADRPFQELGLDSLMAVELRNALQRLTGLKLPATLAFDHPTVDAVTALVVDRLGLDRAPEPPPEPAAERPAARALPRAPARAPEARDDATPEAVAIVGLALRMPGGADSPEAFWQLLEEGRDTVIEVPPDRWDVDAVYDPIRPSPGKTYVRAASFLDDIASFDAGFFRLSPAEATALDPAQRLLLEVSWEALERAGIAPTSLHGSDAGVFVGVTSNEYGLRYEGADKGGAYGVSGADPSFTAGRLAYVLGAHGPAFTVNTACSSSLVALHQAVRALRAGECGLALAAGANVMTHPNAMIGLSQLSALAPDGRCKTFDASADGYGRGEGCGVLVLRRLSDAVARREPVLAVIRGSAINHDGASQGLTVPSGPAQTRVIRDALRDAGLEGRDVDLLECHGTGTPLGDPIEVRAADEAYGEGRAEKLILGSVKSNVGHLEGAAGIAGVLKVVLALAHGRIPKTQHVRTPNPELGLDELAVRLATEPLPWPALGRKRRAAVSAFGFSGTNAHVILEEGQRTYTPGSRAGAGPHLVVLSGRTPEVLAAASQAFARALDAPAAPLGDLAHTLAVGRAAQPHRLAVVARDAAEAARLLRDPDGPMTGVAGEPPKVAFLFTGQGAQYAGMARALHAGEPAFRDALERCFAAVADTIDLREVVFSGRDLDDTANTQPAMFAVGWALAELYRSWGITPYAVAGHSLGEYVAATVAGVFSLPDALRLVVERGRWMSALPRDGAMAAVFAAESRVRALAPGLDVAAVNGATETVLSGRTERVAAATRTLESAGIRVRPLRVSHAFHSELMDPILDRLEAGVARLPRGPARLPIAADLTGTLETDALGDPLYWRRQARAAVRMADALRALHAGGCRVFLELGPHPTLAGMAERALGDEPGVRVIATLQRERDDRREVRRAVGELFTAGVAPDWAALAPGDVAAVPTTRFQREPYWIGTKSEGPDPANVLFHPVWEPATRAPRGPIRGGHHLVGAGRLADRLRDAFSAEQVPTGAETAVVVTAPDADPEATVLRALEVANASPRVLFVGSGPAHAALLGFARALRAERGEGVGWLEVPDDPKDAQQIDHVLVSLQRLDGAVRVVGGRRLAAGLVPLRPVPPATPGIRPDGAYLVTGGLGALGLVFAKWLVDRGATHVVLTGRSGASVDALEALGPLQLRARVDVVRADVAERADVDRVLAGLGAPLFGVIHAAGVLDDGLVANQTPERFAKVLAPKIRGARNLDAATRGQPVHLFVLCSSIAGLLGNAGQTSYAAANAWMDDLAERRRAENLPAVSVAFGPWAEVGMATRLSDANRQRLEDAGMTPLRTRLGLAAFERALGGPPVVAVAGLRMAPTVATAAPGLPGAAAGPALGDFGRLHRVVQGRPRDAWVGLVADELDALACAAKPGVVFDRTRPLWDQGLDSMILLELRNQVLKAGVQVPVQQMIGGPPIDDLARVVVGILENDPRLAEPRPAGAAAVADDPRGDTDLDPLPPVTSHLLAASGGLLAGLALALVVYTVIAAM